MNSPLRIAVCEDDARDTQLLLGHIDAAEMPVLPETFYNAEGLVASFRAGKYDLVFLDIYMDGPRGIGAAHAIRALDEEVVLAFTTSSADHSMEGYRLGVLKYLEKPVTAKAVAETLQLAAAKRKLQKTILLPAGGRMAEFFLNDILFFEMNARLHAVQVHCFGEVVRLSQSVRLEDIEAAVPQKQFIRCHRGYIVNLRWVRGFDETDFVMESGEKVYVRMKDGRKMRRAHEEYMFSLARRQNP